MGYKDNKVWKFFRSVRLTIFLLVILAAVAVVGTLVPQREEAFRVMDKWNPKTVEVFRTLGLFDLYHSLMFRLLLLGLGLNLVVCSIDRFPKSLRMFRHSVDPTSQSLFESPLYEMKIRDLNNSVLVETLRKAMRMFGGKGNWVEKEGALYAHTECGRFSYFGVYFVHLSVVIILIGGLVGSIFGIEGYVNILEGGVVDRVELREKGLELVLGFQVRCDKFQVEFYPNGAPKEYRSKVTILKEGKELFSRDILVNHPMEVAGIKFFQASYGSVPYGARVEIKKQGDGILKTDLEMGSKKTLDHGMELELLSIKDNFMNRLGPAVLLRVTGIGTDPKEIWIFKDPSALNMIPQEMRKSPRLDPNTILPYQISVEEIKERFYTGLQVSKIPGMNMIWFGCFVMIVGFFMTFFYQHRQLWFKVQLDNKRRLIVAARTNKDQQGLEAKIEKICNFLEKEIGEVNK